METGADPLLAVGKFFVTLIAPLGALGLLLRTKGAKAFRADLQVIQERQIAHEQKDETRFTDLSRQVTSIDKKVARVVVLQQEEHTQAAETRVIIEKIRDHLLEQK